MSTKQKKTGYRHVSETNHKQAEYKPNFILIDRQFLYAFARACGIFGVAWNHRSQRVSNSNDYGIREFAHHPYGHSTIIDNQTGRIIDISED